MYLFVWEPQFGQYTYSVIAPDICKAKELIGAEIEKDGDVIDIENWRSQEGAMKEYPALQVVRSVR